MKKIIGYVAVGVAGYFIGFYEYKHKMTSALLEAMIEKQNESDKEESEKES